MADALTPFLQDDHIGLLHTSADGRILQSNATAQGQLQGLLAPGHRLVSLAELPPKAVRQLLITQLPLADGTQLVRLAPVRPPPAAGDAPLHDAAHTDPLTQVGNRGLALAGIEGAMKRLHAEPGRRFAVLFINCDRFNRINVTLGPTGGDELLRQMASRLNSLARPRDAVARAAEPAHTTARLGGDEFVVLIEGLHSADDLSGVAQRTIDALGKPYRIAEQTVHCTASVGVVVRDHAADDADSVLHDASLAMREAKRTGGARYSVFEPAMKEQAMHRGSIESDLRQGLAEGQFYVVYQPIVDLGNRSARVDGVEALVRWKHPVRGHVPPIEFIEIAEESGLIGQLGVLVLNEACQQFARWRSELGDHAPQLLSVNLSRAQLLEPTLLDDVRSALSRSGLPGPLLQLEITESLAAQDEIIQSRLHGLKTLGLTLALDDFGTGYSSLASLHLMPVDVVKIDRSFVSQIETSVHHRVLIQATVQVAGSLGMRTVAEGIETAGQAELLRALACDKGQGYYFARPMPGDDVGRWLLQRGLAPTGLHPAEPAATGQAATHEPGRATVEAPNQSTGMETAQAKLFDSIQQSHVAIGLFDPGERLVYGNPSYLATYWRGQTGLPTWEEVMRQAHRSGHGPVITTANIEAWLANVRRRYRQQPRRIFESDISDGRWMRVTEETRADGWQLCVATDITSLKVTEAELKRARDQALLASVTDPLTELPNRRHVFERLADQLDDAHALRVPMVVVAIDLDEFKTINDTHGHAVGDQVLVAFAQALKGAVRQCDAVGRIGGEEFLVVLANTGRQGADRVLGQLREAMAQHPLMMLVAGLKIGFSAGFTEVAHGDDVESICHRADLALYQAKSGGRGCDQFAPADAPADPVTRRRTAGGSDPETGHKRP